MIPVRAPRMKTPVSSRTTNIDKRGCEPHVNSTGSLLSTLKNEFDHSISASRSLMFGARVRNSLIAVFPSIRAN